MRLRPVPPASRRAGFTLIEVLVTLMIVSFLVMALLAGMRAIQRDWNMLRSRGGAEDAEAVLRLASGWLEQAVPTFKIGADHVARGTFQGRPDDVSFVTSGQGHVLPHGLIWVRLHIEGPGRRLVATWSLFRPGDVVESEHSIILLNDVTAISFRYLAAGSPRSDANWKMDWLGQNDLPRLIEIGISDAGSQAVLSVAVRSMM